MRASAPSWLSAAGSSKFLATWASSHGGLLHQSQQGSESRVSARKTEVTSLYYNHKSDVLFTLGMFCALEASHRFFPHSVCGYQEVGIRGDHLRVHLLQQGTKNGIVRSIGISKISHNQSIMTPPNHLIKDRLPTKNF